ncbi:MAG TPA: hypothetical protein VK003_15575 [Oceanobacillus sp.]|nr:hypothetical protein [Oceanobacillus sp.]
MTLQLAQLGTMIKYELLMSWRRRSLIVTVLFLFVGLAVFTATIQKEPLGAEGGEILYMDDTVTPATVTLRLYETGEVTTIPADDAILANIPNWLRNVDLEQVNATLKVATLLPLVTQLLIIMLLLMSAETIPLDKHYRVRELLNTLPVARATYLGGKLLGVWVGLLIGIVLCALLYIPIATARFGSFDMSVYLKLWGIMLIPAATFASGISILAAAGVATRRMSVLVGLVMTPIGVGVFALVIVALYTPLVGRANEIYTSLTYDGLIGSMVGNTAQIMLFANLGVLVLGIVAWIDARVREG